MHVVLGGGGRRRRGSDGRFQDIVHAVSLRTRGPTGGPPAIGNRLFLGNPSIGNKSVNCPSCLRRRATSIRSRRRADHLQHLRCPTLARRRVAPGSSSARRYISWTALSTFPLPCKLPNRPRGIYTVVNISHARLLLTIIILVHVLHY